MSRTMDEEWYLQSAAHTIESAREGTKAALLINGGAAIALLALLGGHGAEGALKIDVSILRWALGSFSLGVASATAIFLFSYLSQGHYTKNDVVNGDRWKVVAIGSALVSLGGFMAGAALSACAVSVS
jgi:uncharacterized integral membrane protein